MCAKTKSKQSSHSNKPRKKSVGPLRRIVAVLLLILAIVFSIVLVVSAAVEYISPLHYSLPALLGLIFPIIALITILLFIALLLIYPKYSFVPLVALLIAAKGMWQYFPINFDNNSLSTNRDSFTFLSYNVYYFVDAQDNETTFNRTLQQIINQNADIVALQEASMKIGINKSLKFTAEQVEQLNEQYPYQTQVRGNRLLSKYPVKVLKDTTYSDTAMTGIYQVEIDNRKVTIINNHLESIGLTKDDKKLYNELTTEPDSIEEKLGEVKVFTKKFLSAFERRAQQVAYVDSIAHAIGGNVIICGDINDTPNSYAYHVLSKNREDAYLNLGTGPGYTYLADRMWVRIDYVLYQGNLEAQYLQRGKTRSSDHYPILVEFGWK